ncbi:MAG TPA: hypothetical protein VMW83_17070 [Spirochaetia bacterium]|nr:hypothetical protein [Spirochaetia bacterium]
MDQGRVTPKQPVALLPLINDGAGSVQMGKEVQKVIFDSAMEGSQVLAENEKVVADSLAGKDKALGFLVGQVMKTATGQEGVGRVTMLASPNAAKAFAES